MKPEEIKKYSNQLFNKIKTKKYGKRFVYETDNKSFLTFGSDKILINITSTKEPTCFKSFKTLFDFNDFKKDKTFNSLKAELAKIKKDTTFKNYTMLELHKDGFIPVSSPSFSYKVISYKYLDVIRLFINKFKIKNFYIIVNEPLQPLELLIENDSLQIKIVISEIKSKEN